MNWKLLRPIIAASLLASTLGVGLASAQGGTAPPPAFAACATCHATRPGVRMMGPDLVGIAGKPAAAKPGFAYSTALKQAKIVWSDAALDRWLQQPAKMVPGTKMFYPGMADPANRAKVIAYLKTLH